MADTATHPFPTCPCALAVRLDYTGRDPAQARVVQALIAELGEFTVVMVGRQRYRVSRHCIALHGIVARQIKDYGFERI